MLDPGRMLEHIPGLPDLMLFWTDDVSVIRVSRCGITCDTLSGQHVLTFIWMIVTDDSFKIVSNWAILTDNNELDQRRGYGSGWWRMKRRSQVQSFYLNIFLVIYNFS